MNMVYMPYDWLEEEVFHEMIEWLDSEIGTEKWGRSFRGNWFFNFELVEDAMAFKLRWL